MPRRQIIETFASWTALSALRSGAPIKSKEDVYPLLFVVDFPAIFDGNVEINAVEFAEWHQTEVARLCERQPKLCVGWATKIINVFLKTGAYVGELGRPGLRMLLHPPIDNGLWSGIRNRFGSREDIIRDTHCVTQIKAIKDYSVYRRIISGCRKVAGELDCMLIEVEQLWEGGPHRSR
jgi:hypothetical protein